MKEHWSIAREVAAGAVEEAGRWRSLCWAVGLARRWDAPSVALLVTEVLVA